MKKVFMLVAVLMAGQVVAQDACIQDEKPHYFVADKTLKTTMPDSLKAVLTLQEQLIWTNTYRSESVVSPVHSDLAACNQALELLEAQRNLEHPEDFLKHLKSIIK